MISWRIYYDGGEAVDNTQMSPEMVPSRGVMVICQVHPDVGREIVARFDYFWFDPRWDGWTGGDIYGLYDYLQEKGWKKVLFGRTIPTPEYEKHMKKAFNDPDFPPKSAKLPKENI